MFGSSAFFSFGAFAAFALGMRIISHIRSFPMTAFTSSCAAISSINRTTFGNASRAAGSSAFANAGNNAAATTISAADGASPAKNLDRPNRAFVSLAASASAALAASNAPSSIAIVPDSIPTAVSIGVRITSRSNVTHRSISFASHASGCVTLALPAFALPSVHSRISVAPSTVSPLAATSTGEVLHAPVYFLNICVVTPTPQSLARRRAPSLPSRSLA